MIVHTFALPIAVFYAPYIPSGYHIFALHVCFKYVCWAGDSKFLASWLTAIIKCSRCCQKVNLYWLCILILYCRTLPDGRQDKHAIAYLSMTDREKFVRFLEKHPFLTNHVSQSTFYKYKPYWLRPTKWLTCKCPTCTEMEGLYATYARVVPLWHANDAKAGTFDNTPPASVATVDRPAETFCWHCRLYNPLHASGPDIPAVADRGLEKLYRASVCSHGLSFDAKTTRDCAHGICLSWFSFDTELTFFWVGVRVCTHGSGPLFRDHIRNSSGTGIDSQLQNDDHDDVEEDKDDGASPVAQDKAACSKRETQLAADTKALGVVSLRAMSWNTFLYCRYGPFRRIKFRVLSLAEWVT